MNRVAWFSTTNIQHQIYRLPITMTHITRNGSLTLCGKEIGELRQPGDRNMLCRKCIRACQLDHVALNLGSLPWLKEAV